MKSIGAALFALTLLCTFTPVSEADAQTTPPPCSAPEHRQFDFWIGAWKVTRPDGQAAGRNVIAPILGGCVLEENWTGATGLTGKSLNIYDPVAKRWHQTWTDSSGTLLVLEGGWNGSAMVLEGTAPVQDAAGNAATSHHRITWTPLEDGHVRQLWETSSDPAGEWQVAFDGHYVRE